MSTDCATAEARVVGWTTAGVRVALAATGGCGRCAARGGCGARWLLRRSDDRRELEIDTEQRPAIGQTVTLALSRTSLVRASVLVYGLPLWLALGATLAANAQSPDHWSLPLVFIAGLALGGVVLRRHLRRRAEAYRPTLVL